VSYAVVISRALWGEDEVSTVESAPESVSVVQSDLLLEVEEIPVAKTRSSLELNNGNVTRSE